MVCPFELCSGYGIAGSIMIICDYNYVFDPNVYLKRFFAEGLKGDYIFLVDEAHNLVERGREMYSATLYKEDFLAAKRILKSHSKRLEQALAKCNQYHAATVSGNVTIMRSCRMSGILSFALMRLGAEMDKFLQSRGAVSLQGKRNAWNFILMCGIF